MVVCLFIISILVFVNGCTGILTGKTTVQIPRESTKNTEVYFCPEEDCGKVYEKLIKSANNSVYCAFYDLELKNIITALAEKSKNADVKLVLDSSPYDKQIKGDGVKLDNNKQLMHNKFCIVDGEIVLTGSFNPTANDNSKNNNNVIVIYSNALAENYEDEFNELWNGNFGKGNRVKYPVTYVNNIKIENYFCPEDDCTSHIIDLIRDSKKSIYFMSFSFTNEEIADALIKKNGVDIRGVLDAQQSANKFSQYKRFQGFKIDVKKDSNKYKMHHKVFIIDNETIVTGSFNPTSSGDTKNDENLLILHDKKIAREFQKEFDRIWH